MQRRGEHVSGKEETTRKIMAVIINSSITIIFVVSCPDFSVVKPRKNDAAARKPTWQPLFTTHRRPFSGAGGNSPSLKFIPWRADGDACAAPRQPAAGARPSQARARGSPH